MNKTVATNPSLGKRGRAILSVLLVLTMLLSAAFPNGLSAWTAYADPGQEPEHHKTRVPNTTDGHTDGTYKIELSVTGDADTEVETAANVNVLLIYDVSSSMTSNNVTTNPNRNRADYAEDVVHDFVDGLRQFQNASDPSNIQVALVTFGPRANGRQTWTSDLSEGSNGINRFFDDGVDGVITNSGTNSHNYSSNNGTNWEAALQSAQTYLNSADADPTFVILITDGACTASGNGNNAINPAGNHPWTDFQPFYNAARDEARAIATRNNTTLFGIYAYGREADLLDDLIYYSQNGSDRPGMNGNTVADTPNYFNAAETDQLTEAIESIFSQIVETLGITAVAISDGTTSDLQATSGPIQGLDIDLLNVDKNSYEYWLEIPNIVNNSFQRKDPISGETIRYNLTDNGNGTITVRNAANNQVVATVEGTIDLGKFKYKWTGANGLYNQAPPAAHFTGHSVDWDLSPVGTLLDGVTYSYSFDVYPSQTTYDIIAQLKNGDIEYSQLDQNIRDYLIKEDNGSYTLETNTGASLSYKDTRVGDTTINKPFTDKLDRVATDASTMSVTKGWENTLDARAVGSIEMTVLMGDEPFHKVTLTDPDWTESQIYISTGLMRTKADNTMEILDAGHDFTFAELDAEHYNWELVTPVMHPMIIDGELTMLILIDEKHPLPDTSPKTYTLNGKEYYVAAVGDAELSAYNYRRSNLNVTKVVDGEDADPDQTFEFTLTVNNSMANDPTSTDTNSDNFVWFSIDSDPDPDVYSPVTDAAVSGSGVVQSGTYWYAPSGTTITVEMKPDWNLRFTNLPTGTTYTFVETDPIPNNYAFVSSALTGGEDSTFSDGQTTTGTIQSTNTSYYVTFTNKYDLADVEITKVWVDANDQDGIRPTAEQFKSYLVLKADGTDVTEANAEKLTVTVNENGTYTAKWNDLNRYTGGTEINYTVEETEIPGYTTTGSPAADHGTITNTHTPEVISIDVTKVWDDEDDQDGIRPTSVTVQLQKKIGEADATDVGTAVTLSASTTPAWSHTWENLPKYSDGTEIVYSVTETPVPDGYNAAVTGSAATGFTVTNKHVPQTTQVTVNKVWKDNDNAAGARPNSVSITLKGNGTAVGDPVTLKADSDPEWSYTWTDLPVNADGEEITYTVEEDPVDDYATDISDISGDAENGYTFTVTNSNVPVDTYTTAFFKKTVTTANPTSAAAFGFTITGSEGAPMPDSTTGTANFDAGVTGDKAIDFGDIIYTEAGTYTYTITETTVPAGWTASGSPATVTVTVTGTAEEGFTATVSGGTITNTYAASGSVVLEAAKTLTGRDLAAEEFSFELKDAEGEVLQTKKNTADGKVTFDAINYTAAGTYTYTITEVEGTLGGVTYDEHVVNVTVTVVDNGDGTLTATPAYSPDNEFVNTYAAEGSVVLEAAKTLTGRDLAAEEFSFELKDAEGEVLQTKKNTADGKVTFDAINYTAAGTYTYTITEVKGTLGGVTYDEHVVNVTVTVVDNGDGTLTATPAYSPDNAFVNTYAAEGKAPISAKKVLEGKTLEADMFSFDLKDSEGELLQTAKNAADGTITFTDLEYDESDIGKTYTYTITEQNGGQRINGISYDGLEVTVTVKIEDNGDGTLKVTVTYSSDTEFNNTYTVDPTKITLGASKTLEVLSGNNPPDVRGKYTLTLKDAEGTVIEEKVNPDGNGTVVNFSEITYTKPGTYIYTVTETGTVAGVTNDEAAQDGKTIVVTVVDNGDGTMTATAKVGETAQNYVNFTNTYSAEPVKVDPPVQKVIVGNETLYNKGNFTFTITGECTSPEGVTAPMPVKTEIKNIADDELEGKTGFYEFGWITFTVPGTYVYTVTESGSAPGVTNDAQSTKTFTFTVTDNGEGQLVVTPTSDEAVFVFTNTYKAAPTTAQIEVNKSLVGKKLTKDDVFTFELKDAAGEVKQTKTNNAVGTVTFDAIEYTEPGTYTYTVTEVEGDDENITTWDEHTVTVTVTVVDNMDGTMTATVAYDPDKIFVNEYTPDPTEAAISVNKALTGRDLNAGEFTFTLTEVLPEDAPEDAEPLVLTATNDAAGFVNFDAIEYDATGTYTYVITEDSGDLGGVTYDTSEITVSVEVTYDEETGMFTAKVIYPEDVTFDNTYVPAPTTAAFEAEKILEGRDLNEGEFSFELKDSTGAVKQTKTNAADGSITFDPITYDEVGTYTYTITEVKGELGGVTYDEGEIEVTVTVTDDLNGNLVATVKYGDKTSFTNTYEAAPTTAVIEVVKTLEGRELNEGEFSFSLLDSEGELVENVKNTEDGKVVFSEITYDEAGTYTYTISETVGTAGGVTYDTGTITVTVTVTDDLEGKLVAEVTYDGEAAEFVNTYAAKGSFVPEVTKVLTGRDLKKGEFTFTLVDANGKLLGTQTNEADGKVAFPEISYTEADAGKTFTYTITETAGSDKDVTYDTHTVTLTVKVEDNGDGTLTVTGTYSGDQTFTNKYTPPEEPPQPKTGDDNRPLLWVGLGGASLAGIIAMLVGRRRKTARK